MKIEQTLTTPVNAVVSVRPFVMYPNDKDGAGFLIACEVMKWQHWTRSRTKAEAIKARWEKRLQSLTAR